jgi:hypothetical protein
VAEQEDTYYNLGNTLYRTGQKTEQSSPQEAIQTWTHAVKAYEAALQLRANDADSTFNRDLVMRKLEALKQKQPQKNQQNKQSQSAGNSQQNQQQRSKDQKQGQQSDQMAQNNKPQHSSQPSSSASEPDRPNQSGQQNQQQTPSAGQPQRDNQAATGADPRKDETAADAQRLPGQMSGEEARELLDSMKDEGRRFPTAPLARSGTNDTSPDQPIKDW